MVQDKSILKSRMRHRLPGGGPRRRPPSPVCLFIAAALGILAIYQLISPLPAAGQIGDNNNQIEQIIKNPKIPWNLEADEIFYDQEYDAYIAKGNVMISKANIKLLADFVRFDQKNMKAYAEGNVVLTNGQDILSGTSMDIDLTDQVGSVEDGYLYIKQNNYHLTGGVIKKVGEKTYTIDDATLTTCDGDNPDWKITGKNVKITEDGSGSAEHATLWARHMPVLYTPYFYYPARKDRQSGLLWPEGGHSNRWGWFYDQPFFWAIDKSSDATFYGQYMSERGMKGGLEYRYYLDDWSKGTWQLDGFIDRKTDDGGDSSQEWGFEDGNQDILRKNQDRYWLRGSHHQQLPYGFRAMLDIDLVSDQDYTREFQSGYMGWTQSQAYFEEVFHRNLNDYNDPIRTNRLNFNRLWPNYTFNAELRYDLNSDIRNSHQPDLTLQQLPLIQFDAIKQRIATSPFFYNLDSQYIYYWSVDGRRTQRIDAYPRFYLPFKLKSYLSLEPSIGLRGTAWRLDKKEYGPEDNHQYYTRGIYDTRLDLFSQIFRIFRIEGDTLEAVKHTLRPRIVYEYIPDIDQNSLPNFDAVDRIENKNLITYSLTNTLTSKAKKKGSFEISQVVNKGESAVIQSPAQYNYNDFFRFQLVQSYDINEAMEDKPEKPFSPLSGRIDLYPGNYIAMYATALWSVYENKFLSHNVGANLWDRRGDKLTVDYRYTRESGEITSKDIAYLNSDITLNKVHSIFVDLQLKVTDRLRISPLYEYNFLDNTRVQLGMGLNYKADCWALTGRILDKTNVDNTSNLSYEFQIQLFGLGAFGI